MNTIMASNKFQILSAAVWEHLKETDLGSYPWIRKSLWKSRFTEGTLHWAKIYMFGYIGMGNRTA